MYLSFNHALSLLNGPQSLLVSLLKETQRAADTQQVPSAPPSSCFFFLSVWAVLRANVFDNYSPLAFRGTASPSVLRTNGAGTHRWALKAAQRKTKQKNTVGGSAEQLPNTCQVEKQKPRVTRHA